MCYTICSWCFIDRPKEKLVRRLIVCHGRICRLVGWHEFDQKEGRLAVATEIYNRDTKEWDMPKERSSANPKWS